MTRGVGGHSPANIEKHLKGIDFPASKSDLVTHAQHGPGPDTEEVVEWIGKLPEKQYQSAADVMKEFGKVA